MPYSSNAPLQQLFDPAPARRASHRLADDATGLLKDRVTDRTPVAGVPSSLSVTAFAGRRGRMPGTLKKSWEQHAVVEGTNASGTPRFSGEVDTQDPIAELVEYPTRPHVIRPRKDRAPASVKETGKARGTVKDGRAALMWFGPGGMVFAREVQHPGTQGSYMMRDGLMDVDSTWEDRVGGPVLEDWAKEQAGLVR
jgi:hypothetical protein